MQAKSSFARKVPKKTPQLPIGTKPSIHNGQLLISTGLHELDEILGGGVAVGTILLVEEDVNSCYFMSLLKYFLAEGIATGHAISVITGEEKPDEFLKNLPRNLTLEAAELQKLEQEALIKQQQEKEAEKKAQPNLTIAWQYEKYLDNSNLNTPKSINQSGTLKTTNVQAFCHSFDLSKPLRPETLEGKPITTIDVQQLSQDKVFQEVYQRIAETIATEFRSNAPETTSPRNILRIGIRSIASPMWTDMNKPENVKQFIMFLHALKGLLRSSLGICMITLPSHLFSQVLVKDVQFLSDTAMAFESFDGTNMKNSSVFADYSGQFFIRKLPRLNSLVSHMPETLNYVFKLKRRKLRIEILHLGPEESRTTAKEKPEPKKKLPNMLCVPGPPSKSNPLDF